MTSQILSVTKKMGRPRKEPTAVIRLPVEVLEAADDWAVTQPDQPGRPEAIRRLLRKALNQP